MFGGSRVDRVSLTYAYNKSSSLFDPPVKRPLEAGLAEERGRSPEEGEAVSPPTKLHKAEPADT